MNGHEPAAAGGEGQRPQQPSLLLLKNDLAPHPSQSVSTLHQMCYTQ